MSFRGGWEVKNVDFRTFVRQNPRPKNSDVIEGAKEPPRRGKKLLPGALRESDPSPNRQFPDPGRRLGDIGGRIKTTKRHKAGYPTRPWAKGPANSRISLVV